MSGVPVITVRALTIRPSRRRFAARLNSGVRCHVRLHLQRVQIKNFRPSGSGYSSPSGWRGDLPKLRRTTCRTSEIRKRESHRPRSNWGARLPHPIPFHRLCVSAGRRRRWYRCICCFRNSTSHFKQAASSGRPQQWHLTIHSSRPCFARRLNSGVRPHN